MVLMLYWHLCKWNEWDRSSTQPLALVPTLQPPSTMFAYYRWWYKYMYMYFLVFYITNGFIKIFISCWWHHFGRLFCYAFASSLISAELGPNISLNPRASLHMNILITSVAGPCYSHVNCVIHGANDKFIDSSSSYIYILYTTCMDIIW